MSEAEAIPSPDARPMPRLGSYQLTEQLGSGGMSNVFRAVHAETGSVVAVKVLPRDLAKNVTLLQRFLREAKSAESLDHPNIVSIFDRGFDQGRHYLVLEYVEGRDLHDRVRLNGPMGIEDSIRLVREVAQGLRYAAGRGMVHRDVKPANLLITPDGHAKIIDLGLALQTEDEDERVTRDGTTVGTVDYMAPEQARDSRRTNERSDIYSLGCTYHYLLTGSPPYPGGGVADKLARHYSGPIPDVRTRNPEVPEPLALLIKKMMAKKPEGRFADYTQLIAALDELGRPADAGTPLDVLIDEDEGDGESDLIPIDDEAGRPKSGGREPTVVYLTAEIVDDDTEEGRPPSAPIPPRDGAGRRRDEAGATAEISLADLAALDDDAEAVDRRRGRRPPSTSASSPAAPRLPGPSMDVLLEEDEPIVGGSPPIRRGGQELPLKTWIAAGVLVGLAIAMVGFGVSLLFSLNRPEEPDRLVSAIDLGIAPELESVTPSVVARPREPRPGPTRPPKPGRTGPTVAPGPAPPVEVSRPDPAVEKAYPRDWEARLLPPAGATLEAMAGRPGTVVRRIAEPGDEPQATSLAAALGRLGEIVEIADTGPFYEDDLQVSGKSRLIRARPGFRPMVKIEPSTLTSVHDQEAKFLLGGGRIEQLTLVGIDLVVDVRDLPLQQSTLFLCRGAAVTLRDCSITLFNGGDRTFSLFRLLEGPRPNRVALERSTIRGPIRTLVEVMASRAEIILDRSLILGEASPLIAVEPAEKPDRSIFLSRSLIATSGPVVEWSGKPSPMAIRSLGSTFARVEGGPIVGLLHARARFAGASNDWLDWSGEDNEFAGWPAWLTSAAATGGNVAEIRTANLAALRLAWPKSDPTSRETSSPWPASATREDAAPADFEGLAPERRGTLARIATPHPRIRELAVDQIRRLPAPALAEGLINRESSLPGGPRGIGPPPSPMARAMTTATAATGAGPLGPTPPPATAAAGDPAIASVETTFDVEAAPWNGDLGRFLAETVQGPVSRAVVRVRGTGSHASSPVRLPEGASVAILGETAEGMKTAMPTFTPADGSAGRSMIEIRGGDIALANLSFAAEGGIRPKHWIRVEQGILAVRHCKFRDPGGPDPAVGPAIAFVAPGPSPIPPRAGPLVAPTDYPTAQLLNCLIWTGGDAISAEVGRGVLRLENCLVISGGPAFSLLPARVPREKFEADLVLDRCTISDDRNAVSLGPWPGDPAGPSRPWLVATRSCLFPRTQREGTSAAMLLVDPLAFARGAVSWHSHGDIYEVGRFLASSGPQPTAPPPPADVKKQWIDLWGPHQSRGDRGPDSRRIEHLVRYKDKERSRPAKVVPQSLELDPKASAMKEVGVDFRNLPPPPAR